MEWISVKDRLPISEGDYYIRTNNGLFGYLGKAYFDGFSWVCDYALANITHWKTK